MLQILESVNEPKAFIIENYMYLNVETWTSSCFRIVILNDMYRIVQKICYNVHTYIRNYRRITHHMNRKRQGRYLFLV